MMAAVGVHSLAVKPSRFVLMGAALAAGCTFEGPAGAGIDAPDAPPDVDPGGRVVDDHLIGVWRFAEGGGMVARDTVQALRPGYMKKPMDLMIESATGYQWLGTDGLEIDGVAQIRSKMGRMDRPHMTPEVIASGAVTLELWVTPADIVQGTLAPGAIFSLGSGPSYCNVRITQVTDHFFGCARTAATVLGTERPLPTPAGTAKEAVQHLVLVADRTTRAFYVDGVAHPAPGADAAPMASWNDTFRITVGDEFPIGTGLWRGRIWFAAVYDRALTGDEVRRNRDAGHLCSSC